MVGSDLRHEVKTVAISASQSKVGGFVSKIH
jgi:hypothetical protein